MIWKSIEGIQLWKLNRTFRKLAHSKIALEEQTKNNHLIIQLPSKKVREVTTQTMKQQLLKHIEELDGFDTLRVCLLDFCKPIYKEQLTQFGVLRWLEIPISQSVKYEFSFTNIKESEKNSPVTALNSQVATQ